MTAHQFNGTGLHDHIPQTASFSVSPLMTTGPKSTILMETACITTDNYLMLFIYYEVQITAFH